MEDYYDFKTFTVKVTQGLMTADRLRTGSHQYASKVYIQVAERRNINAKSIMGG